MAQDDPDSESGLPEIISFSTSASLAKGQHHALRSFHTVEKRKIKERHKRHDERLKAQAKMRRCVTATTGKSKHHAENHEVETGDDESGSDLDPRLHRRMTRAMGDAEEEMEGSDSANASADEWGGINVAGGEEVHWQAGGGQDVEMSRGEGTEETEESLGTRILTRVKGKVVMTTASVLCTHKHHRANTFQITSSLLPGQK